MIADIFCILIELKFLGFAQIQAEEHQVPNSHHALIAMRALRWDLDHVDGVNVQRIFRNAVAISCKL